MKRRSIAIVAAGVVVVSVVAAAWYFLTPRVTPLGQHPLMTLGAAGVSPVTEWFNSHVDSPRIILMLSPT